MPMFDFNNGRGPVPAHQHVYGGGWVADTAHVDSTAYVGPDARVYGQAQVYDQAEVRDQARVYGQAQVSDLAWVYGQVHVYGQARVGGHALVHDYAQVYTVTPEEATLLTLKYNDKIKIESLVDLGLVQVYDHNNVIEVLDDEHV